MNNDFKRRKNFLTRGQQARRYNKSRKTIKRWGQNPAMGMPPEYNFNGLPHREEGELEDWEKSRVAAIPDNTKRDHSAKRAGGTAAST